MPLSVLCVALALAGADPVPAALPLRESRHRTVWLDEAAEPEPVEVFVAPGVLTSLWLPAPIRPEGVELDERWGPLFLRESELELMPERAVPSRERAVLRVTLGDGTRLAFRLITRPGAADAFLFIRWRPVAGAEEAARRLQARLARPEAEGLTEKAQLIADFGSEAVFNRVPGAPNTDFHPVGVDVTFVEVFHDAGISYATLKVKNASQAEWRLELDRVKLFRLMKAGGREEVRILSRASEGSVVGPREGARLVLAYETLPLEREKLIAEIRDRTDVALFFVAVAP